MVTTSNLQRSAAAAFLFRIQRRYSRAIDYYLQSLRTGPNPDALLGLLDCYMHLGDTTSSERYAAEAQALIAQDDWYYRARLQALSGRIDLALDYLGRAAEKYPVVRSRAWREPDLEPLRADPRFRGIVGPPPGPS